MTDETVLLDVKGAVAYVTLNRPGVHNAFDETVIARLTGIFDDLAGREDIYAVVLRGNGKSFSAGADMNWMKRAASFTQEQNESDAMALATMLNKLYTLPKVTIACVQGAAMGGGMGLVCCCDIVIALENAKFALSEVRIGMIPATIAPYVIAALGTRQSRRYFQTGERFDGTKAYEIGLVHEVCGTEGEVSERLENILQALNSNGPKAMAVSKRLCLDLAGEAITPDLMKDTANRIAATRANDEAIEGLSAFLEKRKAGWVRE